MDTTQDFILWPPDDIDPKKKDGDWVAQYGRAIMFRYNNGNLYYNANDLGRLREIRDYTAGHQSPQKYMDNWAEAGREKGGTGNQQTGGNPAYQTEKKGRRKGYANIDWSILPIAPLFMRVIQGLTGTKTQRIDIEALSTEAKQKKLITKYETLLKSKLRPLMESLGREVKKPDFDPQDRVELELYEMMGGFNLNFEIGAKKLIKSGIDTSKYHTVTEPNMKEDLVNYNFIGTKIYCDPTTGAAKVRYVDPMRTVTAYIQEDRGSSPSFAGDFHRMSIPDFRNLLLLYFSPERTEELCCAAAKADWQNQSTSINRSWDFYNTRDTITNRFRYDGLSVDVLEFEFISKDANFYKKRDREGYQDFFADAYGDYVNNEKKKTVVVEAQMVYEGYYVPVIDIGFGGKQTNIMRRDKKTPVLSYTFKKVSGKAIGESLIPLLDSIQMCWLKLNAARMAAKPKGVSIELAAINSISLGGQTLKPTEIIKIYNETGVIYYKAQLVQGKVVAGGMPIQELEGGIGKQGAEWVMQIAHDINLCFQISGITPIMAASPDISPETLVGVANAQQGATINNLAPLQDALEEMYAEVGEKLLMKALVVASADESARAYYEGIIGQDKMDELLLTTGLTLQELGITVSPRVGPDKIQAILDGVDKAIAVGRNGQPTATASDKVKILDMLRNGFIEEAGRYLQYVEQKRAEAAQEQASAASKQQADQLKELEGTKMQAEIEKEKAKAAIELEKEMKMSAIRIAERKAEISAETKADAYLLEIEALVQLQTGKDTGTKIPVQNQNQFA